MMYLLKKGDSLFTKRWRYLLFCLAVQRKGMIIIMIHRKIGETEIPAIALGTWSWGSGFNGGNSVFGNNLGENELKPVFEKAMEEGLTLWDTAAVYGMGASETILGNLIAKHASVDTKLGIVPDIEE